MRALRRGVLSYWYATLEDEEAAAIEAATATWYVNILDESVFEKAFEEQYRQLRAKDRLGRVVMGLELIRNCETHAPVVFDGLLVDTHWYGVPISTDAFTVRRVFAWAQYDALPKAYRDRDVLSPSITDAQRRARGAVQDRYRKDVEGRPVIETLFDAMAFFHSLDTRLVGPPAPSLRWSFAEIPDTDPELAEPRGGGASRCAGRRRRPPAGARRAWARQRGSATAAPRGSGPGRRGWRGPPWPAAPPRRRRCGTARSRRAGRPAPPSPRPRPPQRGRPGRRGRGGPRPRSRPPA